MKKLFSLSIVFFLTLTLAQAEEEKVIDMHSHFSKFSVDQIISSMDEYGIDRVVFMAKPKVEDVGSKLEKANLNAAAQYPDRIIAFYGGDVINRLIYEKDPNSVTKKNKKSFRKKIKKVLDNNNYQGLGELAPLHYSLEEGQPYIEFRVDHPYMLELADLAAKYNIPMDIHMEATTDTLSQFKILLAHNKKAKIIWDHAGWSNTGLATPKKIKSLMSKYHNLYSSIKLRKSDSDIQEVNALKSNGKLKNSWKNLFKKYPNRFIIGTDMKFGHGTEDYKIVDSIKSLLSCLSSAKYDKIVNQNASRILNL